MKCMRHYVRIDDKTGDDGEGIIETYMAPKDVTDKIIRFAKEKVEFAGCNWLDRKDFTASRAVWVRSTKAPIRLYSDETNQYVENQYITVICWRHRAYFSEANGSTYTKFGNYSL